MNKKAHDLATYNFIKGEPLLLDTNVWLYLYPPSSEKRTAPAAYSAALKDMLSVGAVLALDSIVLSEYLTVYCRLEYRGRTRANTALRENVKDSWIYRISK